MVLDDLSAAPSRKVHSAMRREFRKQRIATPTSSIRYTNGESRLLIYTAPTIFFTLFPLKTSIFKFFCFNLPKAVF